MVDKEVLLNRLRFIYQRYAQAEKRQRQSVLTMKWNFKLDMENETGGQIPRHLLPTRMSFYFLTHRTKILKFYS